VQVPGISTWVRDLYLLSTAVKALSMAKAVGQLAMSQTAVSEAIANLELMLGVRLLDRGSRGIVRRPGIPMDRKRYLRCARSK
jgi:Bacterial regulatory helix-turn-helix protein, lysR family